MTGRSEFTVTDETPKRLDVALQQALVSQGAVEFSRSQIQHWIEAGAVQVNGKVVSKAGQTLKVGSRVAVTIPEPEPSKLQPLDLKLEILFEDKALIVVNKPQGLSMHPGSGNRTHTLANALISHFGSGAELPGSPGRPGIVHRLDKDTTGVVVVAKTVQAHAKLSEQFAGRTVDRAYLALAICPPRGDRKLRQEDSGEIDAPIGRHRKQRTMFAVDGLAAKKSITRWKVLERMEYAVLTELRLGTGRTHQIRVHLAHIGSPIIGDQVYSGEPVLPKTLALAAQKFGRQALHAYRLGFVHPTTGEQVTFESPLPADFEQLLTIFRKKQ